MIEITLRTLVKRDEVFIPIKGYLPLPGEIGEFEGPEGALELIVDNVVVLDTRCWDYLNILWCYIINDLYYRFKKGQDFTSCFPEQDINIKVIHNTPEIVTVSVNSPMNSTVKVKKNILFSTLITGAEEFFQVYEKFDEGCQHKAEREILSELIVFRNILNV